ncbi:MAG: DNA mismatch repair endonuclease MutL [Candidatus Muirbacterium halophilum]|nr:DNA mismatch repair endonuclease MutL [Candidatus Muirbacterium halophilum]MCK9477775.1 DNA mismatch repair endonuclease MutL [Candidatus Muirbacterium halophilum]
MIKKLSQEVYSKIAAGEVIHKPYSAVKELIENSIDSGADYIEIEIKDGGKKYICVTDTGSGMSKEDLDICFLKHATSKLSEIEDLDNIISLGFRGEALYSIAAVSKIEISSKQENSPYGTKIRLEDLVIKKISPIPMNRGTKIEIKNLFYNMPVRQKFLKSSASEARAISEVVIRYILSYPNIRFKFISNNREIFISPGNSDLLETIGIVFGNNFVKNIIPVEFENNGLKIKGYTSNLELFKSNSKYQYFFINHRYIKNNFVSYAVSEAYKSYFREKKYPVFFLDLEISPSMYDVNIHPSKEEVKFLDERLVFSTVRNGVLNSLRNSVDAVSLESNSASLSLNSGFKSGENENFKKNDNFDRKDQGEFFFPNKNENFDKTINSDTKIEIVESQNKVKNYEIKKNLSDHKVLGQIINTYIVVESINSLMLIDQHVAHERILYEKYKTRIQSEKVIRQRILFPLNIEVKPYEAKILESRIDLFKRLGFSIERFGESMFVVREIPVFLNNNEENIIREIIDEIFTSSYVKEFDDLREEIIINASCKNAIKAGRSLSFEEMDLLINELFTTLNPYTCPHGRPIILEYNYEDITKKFGRSPLN